tara:strand:+ start:462 stop:635 length:174 start_codon:yes stop_codon:yes gene_type:complete
VLKGLKIILFSVCFKIFGRWLSCQILPVSTSEQRAKWTSQAQKLDTKQRQKNNQEKR